MKIVTLIRDILHMNVNVNEFEKKMLMQVVNLFDSKTHHKKQSSFEPTNWKNSLIV